MSVKIMGMVWDSDLPRNEKYVLLAYADHADHDGRNIYPSVPRMAWKTGYDDRAVQRITKKLINKGILARDGEGPNGTNLYRIVLGNLPARPDFQGWQKDTPGKKTPVAKRHPKMHKMTPKPSSYPSLEEVEEKDGQNLDFAAVCLVYQNEIGALSQIISDAIDDDLKTYPAGWIIEAMKRAALANHRRYSYVQGILKNWLAIGGPQNDNPREKPWASAKGQSNGNRSRNNQQNADPDRIPSVDPFAGD